MVRHYELILFYACGFRPKDAIRLLGTSRTSAYRGHRIYREAGLKLRKALLETLSVPPVKESRVNNLDDLRPIIDGLGLRELKQVKGWITRRQKEL